MYIVFNGVSLGTRIRGLRSLSITSPARVTKLSEIPAASLPRGVPQQGTIAIALDLKEPEEILAARLLLLLTTSAKAKTSFQSRPSPS